MSLSDTYENLILDAIFGATAYSPPGTLYCALFTTACTDSALGTEATGGDYARVSVTNNATNFPAAAAGIKSNGTVITFPEATASWGTVVHFAWMLLSSGGNATNMVNHGALLTPLAVTTGVIPRFPIGSLLTTCN